MVTKRPTASTWHTCMLCARRIQRGERYVRQTWFDAKGIIKICEHCDAVISAIYRDYLADDEECDANLVKEYLGATSPVLAYLFTNGWEARGTLIPADLIESVLNHA